MTDKQAEALELADLFESWAKIRGESENGSSTRAARELRRLHARVVELEEMLRKEVQHSSELTSQLEAIGAGGVESLRGENPLSDSEIAVMASQATRTVIHATRYVINPLSLARAIERAHGIGS